ncbi:hypothetical protein ACQ4PT_041138 [Festuca glaucescens]
MSMSGADFSGVGEDPRIFRNVCRDRILKDMLKPDKDKENKSAWKVLIMDKFTVRIIGYACKMAEITDAGVSLVEDLFKRREPMPSMDAIYFLQPLKEKAYIFFSSPIPKDLVTYIKNDMSVIPRIGALREMNLEFFAIDMQVSKAGSDPEKKEALLEDQDPLWIELRHTHIADASERLYEKMNTFVSKNKAAQLSRDGGEVSTTDLQKIVQALPQYSEQVEKLTLHIEIAGKINKFIREYGLRDIGQVEQDLVFGDAGAKEVINILRSKQNMSQENKLRLLIIYAIVCPDKFEGDKGDKLMQVRN